MNYFISIWRGVASKTVYAAYGVETAAFKTIGSVGSASEVWLFVKLIISHGYTLTVKVLVVKVAVNDCS